MPTEKDSLIAHIRLLLTEKIEQITKDIENTRESMTSETKSSAGDKHETGRAMVQNEIETKMVQLGNLNKLINDVSSIVPNRNTDDVGFGSLIYTNKGKYFLAIGLGKITVESEVYFVISMDSPIGSVLNGSKRDDKVNFRDLEIQIEKIL